MSKSMRVESPLCKQLFVDTLRDGSLQISLLIFLKRKNYLKVYIFYVHYSQLEAQI